MSVFKRGWVYWYEFCFGRARVRESSKSASKTLAKNAKRTRRRELEESFNRLKMPPTAVMFEAASDDWLESKKAHLAPRSVIIERVNLKHLKPTFGKRLICDISGDDVARYQASRLQAKASPKTINLEVGTLRAVLRKNRLWATIQPDVKMLRASQDVGRAISATEEAALLKACRKSRSRSLYPAVVLALNSCMRYSEFRLLQWGQVDFASRALTVGQSKTDAGTGRVLQLNDRAFAMLSYWAGLYPERQREHYVFPSERYGATGNGFSKALVQSSNPETPIGRWKEAWESAKNNAEVKCRFHDLRHMFISLLTESQASDATLRALADHVSRAMMERYSHIRMAAKRRAVEGISGADFEPDRE